MSKARKADDALVLALACGLSAEQAAKQAGVSPATVYRRLQDPAFQTRAEEIRHEILTRAAAMLTAAGVESVRTLADLLKSSYAPTVRLNAARSILDLGVKLRSLVELEDRLLDLEDRVKQSPPNATDRTGAYRE